MKKIIGFCLLAALCTGCAAHMMETRGDKIALFKSPNEKPGKGGVIRYLNTGFDSWKKARRADAERQMEHFCGGPYTITADGPRSKFGASMPIGSSVSFEVDQNTYIAFDCKG
jgi:hypothetical protein